ncbi:hypothetical protein [Marinomonas sp. THO17]|uniref:tetratricopeptide repeat protein n=1 Tax=Marinomonas sp. THO17 TaxID=3149048 RepID=UPI00336BCF36
MILNLLLVLVLLLSFAYLFYSLCFVNSGNENWQDDFYQARKSEIAVDLADDRLTAAESKQLLKDLQTEKQQSRLADIKWKETNGLTFWAIGGFFIISVLGSLLIYQHLGFSRDWRFQQAMQAQELTAEKITTFLQYRSRRYDRAEDWYFEAVDLVQKGQYQEALSAFQHALDKLPEKSADRLNLLVEYAQAVFYANNNQSSVELENLIAQILLLDPHQANALGLKGVVEFDRKNYLAAVLAWQEAIRYNANSTERLALLTAINKARNLGKIDYQSLPPIITHQIAVQLEWDPKDIQWQPNQVLLVYAQQVGQVMPVAIQRVFPKDLASPILLTNLDAVMPTANLSEVQQVNLVVKLANLQDADLTKGQIIGTKSGVFTNRKEIYVIKLAL